MSTEFDDSFWTDLDAIDGPQYDDWLVTLLFRIRDFGDGDPFETFRVEGMFTGPAGYRASLCSARWAPSGVRNADMRLWHVLRLPDPPLFLLAEHAKSLKGKRPLDVTLGRASTHGLPLSDFVRLKIGK